MSEENKVSLEELYGIKKTEKCRKTLRELKEKDQLILKLRENCLDLVVKFADAQNTIDQLRFFQPPHLFQIQSVGYLEKVANWKTHEYRHDDFDEILEMARRVRQKAIELNAILTFKPSPSSPK